MVKRLQLKRSFLSLLLAGCLLSVSSNLDAKKSGHDANVKAKKTEQRKEPRGRIAPHLALPRMAESSAAIASTSTEAIPGGKINFSLEPSAGNSAKAVKKRIAPVAPLRGCVSYNAEGNVYGMVEITENGLVCLRDHENFDAGWGGTGVGSRYYYNTLADAEGTTIYGVEGCLWDAEDNWRMIGYDMNPDLNVLSYSMTCHPVTEEVWGCFFNSDLSALEIGTLDPMTMKRTGAVGPASVPLYAMGFSSDLTLWGIDRNGTLYTISTTDGTYTKVADTGLATTYNTGGTIDSFNDVFYYAVCPSGPAGYEWKDWALYSIDLKNGFAVEKCWNMTAEICGMYVANAEAKASAPARPTLGTVSFPEGSLSGKISFTAPNTTYDGQPLSGILKYGVLANQEVVATGSIGAGSQTTVNVTLPEPGNYTIRVYVSNSNGTSPKSSGKTEWYGPGVPDAPQNVKAVFDSSASAINVTWDPVTTVGAGYLNTEDIRYSVYRTVDDSQLIEIASNLAATEYTDTDIEAGSARIYHYAVAATQQTVASALTESEYVLVGTVEPPFSPDMAQPLSSAYFTSLNYADNDLTIAWQSSLRCMGLADFFYPDIVAADMAMVTVPIRLEGGKAYEVTYSAFNESPGTCGFGLQWGKDRDNLEDADDMYILTNYNGIDYPLQRSVTVIPEEDGLYYFAVHIGSEATYALYVGVPEFRISEGLSKDAPKEITQISFDKPKSGAYELTMTLTAPAKTIAGANLSDLTKIEVKRDGQLVKTFNAPTMGQSLSFVDKGTKNTDVVYEITAFNSKGQGKTATVGAHMGVNLPQAPINIDMVQDLDNPGNVTITWTPVAKDIDGFEFDPSLVRYAIYASDYSTLITQGITAAQASADIRVNQYPGVQSFLWFCVVPYTEAGVNGYAGGFGTTPMIPIGDPYEMPMRESFTDNHFNYAWGQAGASLRIAGGISSSQLTIDAQDNDNGLVALYCAPGDYADLFSANVKIDNEDDVALSFWYTGVPDVEGYILEPYVIYDRKKEALCAPIDTKNAPEFGWNNVRLPMNKYKGKTVQFGVLMTCVHNNYGFGIDNIVLKRFYQDDLRAVAVNAPHRLYEGKDNTVSVEVVNDGKAEVAAGEYSVELYADGKLIATKESSKIGIGQLATYDFTLMPNPFAGDEETYHAYVRWARDMDDTNNTTATVEVPVLKSSLPTVEDLEGTLSEDGYTASLEWSEPYHTPEIREITESFETYEPFLLSGFGDWTVVDEDGGQPYNFNNTGLMLSGDYPKYIDLTPHSWILVDFDRARVGSFVKDTLLKPVSGSYAIMADATSDGQSLDWLISPELPGQAQTVSFYAAACEGDNNEYFEFYYSTTGKELSDFIMIGDENTVPGPEEEYIEDLDEYYYVPKWYEYSFELPEGAKYFAIRYTSDDLWGMVVDDITYTVSDAVLELLGYNVYCNGDKLNESLLTATSFNDDLADRKPGTYEYGIVTVYDRGQSSLGNKVSVTVQDSSKIDELDTSKVNVIGGKGYIRILGAEGLDVALYTTSGLRIESVTAESETTINVEPGLYLVDIEGTTVKVIVK